MLGGEASPRPTEGFPFDCEIKLMDSDLIFMQINRAGEPENLC